MLSDYGLNGPAEVREAMLRALRDEMVRIGAPDCESTGMADPTFAAMSALNHLDTANYELGCVGEGGQQNFSYTPLMRESSRGDGGGRCDEA